MIDAVLERIVARLIAILAFLGFRRWADRNKACEQFAGEWRGKYYDHEWLEGDLMPITEPVDPVAEYRLVFKACLNRWRGLIVSVKGDYELKDRLQSFEVVSRRVWDAGDQSSLFIDAVLRANKKEVATVLLVRRYHDELRLRNLGLSVDHAAAERDIAYATHGHGILKRLS